MLSRVPLGKGEKILMMNKAKYLGLVLAIALLSLLVLAACDNNNQNSQQIAVGIALIELQ